MKVLFSNPPWWAGTSTLKLENGQDCEVWTGGLRAGSRWPFTTTMRSQPTNLREEITVIPFLWGWRRH